MKAACPVRLLRTVAFLAPALVAISCATEPATPGSYSVSATWSGVCHDRFKKSISRLAGPDVVDCGFLGSRWTKERVASTHACATNALASGHGFKTGFFAVGEDGFYCRAVVRTAEQQVIAYAYNRSVFDTSVWVERCESVDFPPNPTSPVWFFKASGCKDADDLLEDVQ